MIELAGSGLRSGRLLHLATVALLAADVGAAEEQRTFWRAVAQDAYGELLDATPDSRFVAVREEVWYRRQVGFVHVIDLQNARTVLTVHVLGNVRHAAIAASGKKLAISTRREIYLTDMISGETALLAEDTTGKLAFDDTGGLLAVQGRLPQKDGGKPSGFVFGQCHELAVYDIGGRKWLARVRTLAWESGHFTLPETVAFEGSKAVGFGTGVDGLDPSPLSPFSYKNPNTFRCHTVLDVATGEAKTLRGQPEREPADGEGQKDEYAGYAVPGVIERKEELLNRAQKLLAAIRERTSIARLREPSGKLAALSDDMQLRFIAQRIFPGVLGWRSAQFTVERNGTISCGPMIESGRRGITGAIHPSLRYAPCCGRLVGWRMDDVWPHPRSLASRADGVLRILDVATGKRLADIPLGEWGRTWKHILPHGVLVYRDGRLVLHEPTKGREIWSVALRERPHRVSTDDSLLVVYSGRPATEILLFDTRTGKERASISRSDHERGRREDAFVAGIEDGAIALAVRVEGPVRSHHVIRLMKLAAPREVVEARAGFFTGQPYWSCLPAGRGRWLVGLDYKESRLLHPDGRWGHTYPAGYAWGKPTRFPSWAGDRILVPCHDGRRRAGHHEQVIFDLDGGRLLERRASPSGDIFAFGERVLVRPTGLLSEVEFVDPKSLKVLFTLHPVPLDETFGWIATTPDGFWDASRGSERYVAVFRNGLFAGEEGTASRRRAGLVGQILGAFLSKLRASEDAEK